MNHKPFYPLKQEISALLEGRMTAIVRPMKDQPDNRGLRYEMRSNGTPGWEDWHGRPYDCPFGNPGTVIWCKEDFHYLKDNAMHNTPEMEYMVNYRRDNYLDDPADLYWRKAISMPKSACRLWLQVVDVKVCKFDDVTDEMALRLGFSEINKTDPIDIHFSPKESFSWYWNHEYPLVDWLWYCEVKLIDKPENV